MNYFLAIFTKKIEKNRKNSQILRFFMKYISEIIADMQKDADKITRAFNKALANEIYLTAHGNARDWYNTNKQENKEYERTRQLAKNATLFKKYSDFEYQISFEPMFIEKRKRNGSKLSSYESSTGEDVSAEILEYEEKMEGTFSKYNINIWEKTMLDIIEEIDKDRIPFIVPKLNTIPNNIKKDLIEELKKKTKKQIEKEYQEQYKKRKK